MNSYQLFFPENLKKYKNLEAIALEFEKVFKEQVNDNIEKIAIYKNLDKQSNEVLDEIAIGYSVDNYKKSNSREMKIKMIREAIYIHRKAGTKHGLVQGMKNTTYPIEVSEWFDYNGDPFKFKIVSKEVDNTPTFANELMVLVDKYKNARSHLDSIDFNVSKSNNLCLKSFLITEIERDMRVDNSNKVINGEYVARMIIESEVEIKYGI